MPVRLCRMGRGLSIAVLPAQAGIPNGTEKTNPVAAALRGIPAYAGMTVEGMVGITIGRAGKDGYRWDGPPA